MQARSVSDIGQWGALQAALPALSFLLLLPLLHISQVSCTYILMQLTELSSPTQMRLLTFEAKSPSQASLLFVHLHAG